MRFSSPVLLAPSGQQGKSVVCWTLSILPLFHVEGFTVKAAASNVVGSIFISSEQPELLEFSVVII